MLKKKIELIQDAMAEREFYFLRLESIKEHEGHNTNYFGRDIAYQDFYDAIEEILEELEHIGCNSLYVVRNICKIAIV